MIIDFTKVREKFPEHKLICDKLETFFKLNSLTCLPTIDLFRAIDPTIINVALDQFYNIIGELHNQKYFKITYKVLDPSMKILLEPSYDSLSNVPKKVLNNFDQWIDVECIVEVIEL